MQSHQKSLWPPLQAESSCKIEIVGVMWYTFRDNRAKHSSVSWSLKLELTMKTLPFYSSVRFLLCLLLSNLIGLHAFVPVCPNDCNGNGLCSNGPQGYCLCYAGYIGVDCSLRTCPSAKAFADFPSANNVAHGDYTECSNMVYFIFLSNIFCY